MIDRFDTRSGLAGLFGRCPRLAVLLLGGLLIGCVVDPAAEQGASETQDIAAQSGESPAAENGNAEAAGTAGQTQNQEAREANAGETGAAQDAEPAAPVDPLTASLAAAPPLRLEGMSQDEVVRHLGKPAFQRRDRTALLLRYREGRCILDLFLYPREPDGAVKAVDYVEARSLDGQKLATLPCINAIQKARTAG